MADWTPQSRAEEILFKTINGEPYDGLPQSRIEELLLELKDVIESGGGGGGGTDNYNLLKNLPQINGQTVKGNMSGTTLGLVNMVMGKDLSTNDYTNADKAIVSSVTADLAEKADVSDIPTKTSDLTNDSGFITNLVNNLLNYYLKSETYSKSEVDSIVRAITTLDIQAVSQLPTTDISTTTIYLVPKQDPQVPDVKDEYINLDGTTSGWELIGNTQIDLSNYVTTSDLTTALQSYATKAYVDSLLNNYTFSGTTTQWANLSTAEKKAYKFAIFTNDFEEGGDEYEDVFSADEVLTNKTWYGKPVYRKCWKLNPRIQVSSNAWSTFNISVADLDIETIMDTGATGVDSNANYSTSCRIPIFVTKNVGTNKLDVNPGTYNAFIDSVFIEYTKTTD